MRNLYEKIDKKINDLKITAWYTANNKAQQLNVLAFIGHGVINE